MPKATTSANDTQRFELKTLPDGYIVLRRMTYGQYLTRREMATAMSMKPGDRGKDFEGLINAMNRKIVEYEFDKTIVEHNLEDEGGNLLDFRKPQITLEMLDPRIGEEIASRIGEMNNFEEDLGNSKGGSTQSSTSAAQQTTK